MKQNFLILGISLVFMVSLSACYSNRSEISEEVMQMPVVNNSDMENRRFMMETYGLREEELEGLDLTRFISDYQLRARDYSTDEIRDILKAQGDMYLDDGTSALFSIFSATGGTLHNGDEVARIGYYCNAGTLVLQAVFDMENSVFYVDNAQARPLSKEQTELLRNLSAKWDVFSWESHYKGEEEPSTGNFGWKLVFELSNGKYAVYSGYTQDMSHLPETFTDVKKELESVIASAK